MTDRPVYDIVTDVYLRTRLDKIPLHSLYDDLISNPPRGIAIHPSEKRSAFYYKLDRKSGNPIKQEFLFHTRVWPYLFSEWLSQRNLRRDQDVIYASQHLIFSNDLRWITDFEFANAFAAYGNINLVKNVIRKRLMSAGCKMIMGWTEWAVQTLQTMLETRAFKEKIVVVRFSVPPQPIGVLNRPDSTIRILFVGSNNPSNVNNFIFKGGYETIQASIALLKKYDNLEVIIKSAVPDEIRTLCSKHPAIRILDKEVSKADLRKLFESSHIFIRAGHEALGPAILEAMSYGLAVVANGIYNIPEAIVDEATGLLTHPPPVKYYTKWGTPRDYKSGFVEEILRSRDVLASEIYNKVSTLIENGILRRRIALEGYKLVTDGKFSRNERNDTLRDIIDAALSK